MQTKENIMARNLLLTSLMLVLLVAACSDSGDDGNPAGPGTGTPLPDTVSFSTTIRPLVASRCALPACHGSASGQGGLAFGGTNPSHATVVSANGSHGSFVVAGNSSASNFYLKVIPNVPNPPGGARMPASGGFLTTDQQNAIKRWIDQGAMDN
jgi:hypothetical protein